MEAGDKIVNELRNGRVLADDDETRRYLDPLIFPELKASIGTELLPHRENPEVTRSGAPFERSGMNDRNRERLRQAPRASDGPCA